MTAIGLLYLMFEDYVTADFTRAPKSVSSRSCLSRVLVGVQIGLIILTILVTRSSVLSMQAKEGLPRGNQIVGWATLGVSCTCPF